MDVLKPLLPKLILAGFVFALAGCQTSYVIKSAIHQAELMSSRVPIEKVIENAGTNEDTKRKLRLSQKVMKFAETDLQLKTNKNYNSFVQLQEDYVTYAVIAAERNSIQPYQWWFPIVGSVPYKGYFKKIEAEEEARLMKEKGFDVLVRGVSAYSTLGWFRDPLLSSMLRMEDHDLVNLLIHETAHATLFVPGEGDLNERFATFVGNMGAAQFYKSLDGDHSATIEQISLDAHDDAIFGVFVTDTVKKMDQYYVDHPNPTEEERASKFAEIISEFKNQVIPKMKTKTYNNWPRGGVLNNAVLASYRTYFMDLAVFEKLFSKLGNSIPRFISYIQKASDKGEVQAKVDECITQNKCEI